MNGTNDKQLERMRRIKRRGMRRFILMRGAVGLGLPCGLLSVLIECRASQVPREALRLAVPLTLGLWLTVGVAVGFLMWQVMMWHYSRTSRALE